MRPFFNSLPAVLLVTMMMVASVTSSRPLSKDAMRKVLANARRLDEQQQNGGDDDRGAQGEQAVEDYIHAYSLQFVECVPDEAIKDADEDNNNNNGDGDDGFYGVVFFRLCPNDSCKEGGTCSSSDDAHFAITLSSYVQIFLEDQAENYNWDDDMMGYVENFDTCEYYEPENDNNQNAYYYVGPTCTEDGLDIRLAVFEDSSCSLESSTSFETISAGKALPFADGGLASTQCVPCAYYDNGEYEVKDLCMDLYDYAPLKCESWPMMHYYWDAITEIYRYGQDTTGCKKIGHLLRKPPSQVNEAASVIILSILVIGTLGGAYYYTIWWQMKKETLERIDSDEELDDEHEDGTGHDYHQHDGTGAAPTPGTAADSPAAESKPEGGTFA